MAGEKESQYCNCGFIIPRFVRFTDHQISLVPDHDHLARESTSSPADSLSLPLDRRRRRMEAVAVSLLLLPGIRWRQRKRFFLFFSISPCSIDLSIVFSCLRGSGWLAGYYVQTPYTVNNAIKRFRFLRPLRSIWSEPILVKNDDDRPRSFSSGTPFCMSVPLFVYTAHLIKFGLPIELLFIGVKSAAFES